MKSIKKTLGLFLTMLMLISAITPVMASDNIKVRLGGELIKFDVQPQLINNRTMVPLRAIFEALGATVDWDNDTQTVTSTKGNTTISLTINNPTMYVNGESVTLDSPACLVDGRTLVPVRAISEAFKLKVEWDNDTKTVIIKKKVSLVCESFDGVLKWNFTYDDSGKELTSFNDAGLTIINEYDEKGNLVCKKYSNGLTYTYEYDENNNCIFQTDGGEYWVRNEYDGNNNTYYIDSLGHWIKFEYDSDNNMTNKVYSLGFSYTYEYDENNNLIFEKSGNDIWTKHEYNKAGLRTFTSDSFGGYSKYKYDEFGNLTLIENSDGTYTKYIVMEI